MMSRCDKDFLNFFKLMFYQEQFCREAFLTGSRAEVKGNQYSLKKFGSPDSMDSDYMNYWRDKYVFSSTDEVSSAYRGEICMYVTEGNHTGYVRLLRDGSEVGDPKEDTEEDVRCGPAYTHYTRRHQSKQENLTEKEARSYVAKIDKVKARHHPKWPREAVAWITRQRRRGSLSHEIIRRVVSYGCDFVCVSHKGYIEPDKYHEWRFSFSIAELVLIKNWSRQQRAMYRTIRVLHKKSLNNERESRLCTYHYKTLMLWAVETKPQCFWNDIMLFDSVRAVLMDMIHCLKIKCLYHYFIPTNNLFDHLLSEDISDDVNSILCICEDIVLIHEVLISCMDEEIYISCKRTFITMPQMLYNSINSLYLILCVCVDPFSVSRREKARLQNGLSNELKTAYGLLRVSLLKQKTLIPQPVTEVYNWYLNELQYHVDEECVRNESVNKIFNTKNCFTQKFLRELYSETSTDNACKSSLQYCELPAVVEGTSKMFTSTTQMKRALYCRSERWIFSNYSVMPFNSTGNFEHQERDTHGETDEKCLKDLTPTFCYFSPAKRTFINTAKYIKQFQFNSSLSPTVPISWFISKAYTANSYYTLFSDYKTTVEICDEILNAYNISAGNKSFSRSGPRFHLSTQWIEIYDSDLQQMLGLAALCRFLIHGSDNRSVRLLSCPVEFGLYLKMRSVIDSEGVMSIKHKTTRVEYDEHPSTHCEGQELLFYGREALTAALKMHTALKMHRRAALIMHRRAALIIK